MCALGAHAGDVSRERAAETAAAFFGVGTQRLTRVTSGIAPLSADGKSAFHAFNLEGGGFVVISGKDDIEPVLAWSPRGRFPAPEEMPANMAWWFECVARQILSLPADDGNAVKRVRHKWLSPAIPRYSAVDQLTYDTAEWDQDDPFNREAPLIGGQRAVTGCVATSGAILAYYHKWPESGTGTIPGSSQYPENVLGRSYDYDNMLSSYKNGFTDTQADAVAALMYDIGTASRMQYGLDASGAATADMLHAFITNFGYSKTARYVERSWYSEAEWLAMIKDNLRDYGPTIYSGDDTGGMGGHQFILDGFDANGNVRVNWGWSGESNCYCNISQIGDDTYHFYLNQDALLGLVPDRNGSTGFEDRLTLEKFSAGSAGLTTSTANISAYIPFSCALKDIVNMGNSTFTGRVYISLYDKDGNLKTDAGSTAQISLPSWTYVSYNTINCIILCEIAPGDRLRARFVGENNGGFFEVGPGCSDTIVVMEEGGGTPVDPADGYTPEQTAAAVTLTYYRSNGNLRLKVRQPVYWSILDSGGNEILSGHINNGAQSDISLSGLPTGTYTVRLGSRVTPYSFTITK